MFLVILAGLLIPVFPLFAQSPGQTVTDDEVNVIARELYCPVCENTPLDVCETLACADWREVIRVKLAEGQSEEQIKDYFVEQYGVRVLVQSQGETVTDDEVNVIARDLFCPVCENTPLDVCETQACADWREVIRVKLAEGQSEEQIKDYFGEQYGVRALAEPPAKGITLWLWLIPIIAVPAGIIIFVFYLRNIRSSAAVSSASVAVDSNLTTSPQPDSESDQDPYTERIEKELRDM
jgi:cytochrome c-type biogenesis protein CcmH